MNAKCSRSAWIALLTASAAALAVACAPWQQFVAADEEEGRVVEIVPGSEVDLPKGDDEAEAVAEQPAYWIGIQGSPIDSDVLAVLRTQLQLADDVGVVVQDVMAGSPAEKAGLRKHDVLIGVGGEQVTDMSALQQAVAASEAKPIELKVIRLAKEMTIAVTPEERPADLAVAAPEGAPFRFEGQLGDFDDILKQFQQGNGRGGVRMLGPGMILQGQQFDLSKMPGGVSVNITREGDAPAKITVKRGDETWTVEGDDEEALKKLPDDLRPFVQQMLRGPRPGAGNVFRPNFNFGELQRALPEQLGRFDFELDGPDVKAMRQRAEEASRRLQERMEEMEQRLQDLQQRLNEQPPQEGTDAAADPSKT